MDIWGEEMAWTQIGETHAYIILSLWGDLAELTLPKVRFTKHVRSSPNSRAPCPLICVYKDPEIDGLPSPCLFYGGRTLWCSFPGNIQLKIRGNSVGALIGHCFVFLF